MLKPVIKIPPIKNISYKSKNPFLSKVIDIYPLTDTTKEESMHIVLDISNSQISYAAGQCVGVIPPIEDANRAYAKPRLYSIASANDGDKETPNTISLTVKRVIYTAESGQTEYGICSNYLCDLKIGDLVPLISPTGRVMLLPKDTSCDLILIATGTGVAPFRAFLKQLEKLTAPWQGNISLYLGYRTKNAAIYCNHLNKDISDLCYKNNYSLNLALSREEKNPKGDKMYVGQKLIENLDKTKKILSRGNFAVYICGLKNMEESIENCFQPILTNSQSDWQSYKKELRKLGRWNVEVY